MICIKVITDKDFNIEPIAIENPRLRYASRGIIFKDNKIAILNKQLKNEFKLIGGGIENEEDPLIAFQREVYEETGCKIKIRKCLGTIEEIKSQDNFKQISYIYVADVTDLGQTHFTEQEINEESQLLWLDIETAMNLIKDCEDKLKPSMYDSDKSVYHTKFIVRRDYEILKYYKENYMK